MVGAQASHHEERCSDGVVAPPICDHRVVPHRWVVFDRGNLRGQPRTPVLCTSRRPFMGRPVPRPLMRNALRYLTTIVPTTTCHRRSYAERYSRSTGT